MLRLDDKSIGQELFVTNIDTIMTIDILVQEALKLSDTVAGFICHFRQPNILPTGCVMTFDIFQEQSDVHKHIQMIALLNLVILLSIDHEKLVLCALGW